MNTATERALHRIEGYSAAVFRDYLGQRFVFRVPESAVAVCGPELDLVLVDVHENERVTKSAATRAERTGKALRMPFSILFRANQESLLSSGLLRMRHPDFEEVPLFISRIQMLPGDVADDAGEAIGNKPHFEAVFA